MSHCVILSQKKKSAVSLQQDIVHHHTTSNVIMSNPGLHAGRYCIKASINVLEASYDIALGEETD